MSSGRSRSAGSGERDDIESVEEILAEASSAHFRFQVPIRRSDQADVGLPLMRLAETLIGSVIEKSQEPRLSIGGQIPDFVKEQRSSLGVLDLSATSAIAPVNAPLR